MINLDDSAYFDPIARERMMKEINPSNPAPDVCRHGFIIEDPSKEGCPPDCTFRDEEPPSVSWEEIDPEGEKREKLRDEEE